MTPSVMGIKPRPGSPEIASSSLGRKPDFLSSSGIFFLSFLTLTSSAFTRGLRRVISKASNTMTWCPYPRETLRKRDCHFSTRPKIWMDGRETWSGEWRWKKAKGRESHQWSSNQFSPFWTTSRVSHPDLVALNYFTSLIFSYSPLQVMDIMPSQPLLKFSFTCVFKL